MAREELTGVRPSDYSWWQRNVLGEHRWMLDVDGGYWCRKCTKIFFLLEVSHLSAHEKATTFTRVLAGMAGIPAYFLGTYTDGKEPNATGNSDHIFAFLLQRVTPDPWSNPVLQTPEEHKNWVDFWYTEHICR
jgi:hypothetical protein